jgi:hypothetical protein
MGCAILGSMSFMVQFPLMGSCGVRGDELHMSEPRWAAINRDEARLGAIRRDEPRLGNPCSYTIYRCG